MLLYVSYFRFLLDSFNLEKCTLSLCSWTLLSVYVWNHVLLFEYLKLAPCNFFWGGKKRGVRGGGTCSYIISPTVLWSSMSQLVSTLLLGTCHSGAPCFVKVIPDARMLPFARLRPHYMKRDIFLCDLVHFFLINSLLWLEKTWRIEIIVTMTHTRPASS